MTGITHLLAVQAELTEQSEMIRQLRALVKVHERTIRVQQEQIVALQRDLARAGGEDTRVVGKGKASAEWGETPSAV